MADAPDPSAATRDDFGALLGDNRIPGSFTARAIPSRLEQVFLNLIQNCLHARRATTFCPGLRPRLRSGATSLTAARVIRFGDHAPGIPARNQGRVFNPFVTPTETGPGTGPGLCACYRHLREAGTEIVVRSKIAQYGEFTLSFRAGGVEVQGSAPLFEPHHRGTVP